jgi:predicted tellurium resistance membrane protein TerC
LSNFYEQVVFYLNAHSAIFALLQVILIDLVMAGDNAVVIGMAAARLPAALRHKVIFWGLAGAVVLRVVMATVTVELFGFVPLRVVGGILLLWVAWRLYRDIRHAKDEPHEVEAACRAVPELSAPGGGDIIMRRAIM